MIHLWLSRQRDGNYMLSRNRPTWMRVGVTLAYDFYIQPGEAIGVRHLCPGGVKALFGVEIAVGDAVQVKISGAVVS